MSFGPETFEFLRDLAAHNSRDWFEANRDRYENVWRDPALRFIAAVQPAMEALDPPLRAEARLNGSLRRINRDVRFSANKAPYSARLHLVFWAGRHPNRAPGMHIVLHPDGIGFGAGQFGLEPAGLAAIRARILDPKDRARLLGSLAEAEKAGSRLTDPDLARLPRGYDAEGDWTHLLRRKAFVARTHDRLPVPDWLFGPQAADEVLRLTQAHLPFIRWLVA
ncbi:MAG: TIGR02453 family protein [Rhodobacteraceae bacterium]|nr:TIGR02453 family protein [Paracoccaceae bacterium]